MPSSSHLDALSDPTTVVLDLFRNAADELDNFPAIVSSHFSSLFPDFDQVPSLTPQTPPASHKDRSLVRFRAMVQDTSLSPEIYLAKMKDGSCGGWGISRSTSSADLDQSYLVNNLRDCTVVWAISVPGESAWCKHGLERDTNPLPDFTMPLPEKYPVPGAPHIGLQAKIYNTTSPESIKSTDLVDFVGILSSEPLYMDNTESEEVPSVPTLHVLCFRRIDRTLVPRQFPLTVVKQGSVEDVWDELVQWVAKEGLAGDVEATKWILLTSISRVQSRQPPILPPAITLSRFPSSTNPLHTPALTHILSLLLSLVVTIPLSLDSVNTANYSPEFGNEGIRSGWLQLPHGCVAIVTESGITEGKITEHGIANIRAVQEMIDTQTLEYVFPYSRYTFESDVAFLVISEGRKSVLFRTNIVMPLKLVETEDLAASLYKPADQIVTPSQEKIEEFRALLGSANVGQITIDSKIVEHIQDDFVNERKFNPGTGSEDSTSQSVTSDDLIHRLLFARLLSHVLQEPELSIKTWEKIKSMDSERRSRIV